MAESDLLDREGAGNNMAALLHSGDEDSILSSFARQSKTDKRRRRRGGGNDHLNEDNVGNSPGDRFCMDDMFLFTDKNSHGVDQVKISGAGKQSSIETDYSTALKGSMRHIAIT